MSGMSEILQMSNRQAEYVLRQIWSQIGGKSSHINFDFDKETSVGNGSVKSTYDHIDSMTIGIRELRVSSDKTINHTDYRNMPVDDYQFMCALVSEFHELSHAGQVKELIHSSSPSASYVMISTLANSASNAYYRAKNKDENRDNYKMMAHEIAAQYSGIRNAHELLTEKLGSEKADALTCMYVNKHIDDEFIKRSENGKYTNVEDIFDAYDKVFVESKTAKRVFNKEDIAANIEKFKSKDHDPSERPDYLIRYLMVYKNGWEELEDVMNNKTGIEQDMFVARAFVLATDPSHKIRKQFKSLKSIDFGTVGIDKVDKIVNRTIDRIRGQYKTSKSITPLNIDDTVVKLSKDVDSDQLDLY